MMHDTPSARGRAGVRTAVPEHSEESAMNGMAYNHYIHGRTVAPAGGDCLSEFDPRTGKPSFRVARGNAAGVDAAVASAGAALAAWRDRRPIERRRTLSKVAQMLREHSDRLAAINQRETACSKASSFGDIETGALYFEYYAGTRAQYEKVKAYCALADAEGVRAFEAGVMETAASEEEGWYVRPRVFTGVTNDMRVAREEIFGPTLSVIAFDDEADAVRIANDTEYGLVAGMWTADLSRAHRLAALLQTGQVFVNEHYAGGVETPFGGFKKSGIGRDKGVDALLHYTQVKCVTVKL